MNIRNLLLELSVLAVIGCSSADNNLKKNEDNKIASNITEFNSNNSNSREIFYDLDSNPRTIEQYVIIKDSEVAENLLKKGITPYFLKGSLKQMTTAEAEQINLRYKFLRKSFQP